MTITELISLALRDANVIGEGETGNGSQMADALATLNQMLAVWAVDNINVYAQQVTTFAPTGALSYTVGTGATVNMIRPAKINAVYWRDNAIDYVVTLLETFEEYESLPQKTEAGEPLCAFYLPSYETGTLYLYPQPSTGTIRLISQVALPASNELADTLTLPAEYVLPIRLNLYVLLAGMFGAQIKPALAQAAVATLRTVRRNNLRIQPLHMPDAIPSYRHANIISGQ